jgi:hypothetical protein
MFQTFIFLISGLFRISDFRFRIFPHAAADRGDESSGCVARGPYGDSRDGRPSPPLFETAEQKTMNEHKLRTEISRRAPHLTIDHVGQLSGKGLDAIVSDDAGQYLWSVYARELVPQPIVTRATRYCEMIPTLPGQKVLF